MSIVVIKCNSNAVHCPIATNLDLHQLSTGIFSWPWRQMETLEQFRSKLVSLSVGTKLDEGVHTVTFQPLKARVNQDRVMTEKWDIGGQTWLFLAVCDGEFVSASQRVKSS
jgi:hypothetical protein